MRRGRRSGTGRRGRRGRCGGEAGIGTGDTRGLGDTRALASYVSQPLVGKGASVQGDAYYEALSLCSWHFQWPPAVFTVKVRGLVSTICLMSTEGILMDVWVLGIKRRGYVDVGLKDLALEELIKLAK